MKPLNDKRPKIWSEIADLLTLSQLSRCMGDNCRTWVGKATMAMTVSRSKKVHKLSKDLINEVNRIAAEFTWFQGIPLERTELVETLIRAHIVAVHEHDHDAAAEIEDYLFELKYAPTRDELYLTNQGGEK